MNCREVRKWISPYLDSELGKTKTFEIGEHLAECERCAERFEAERRADEMIRSRVTSESMPDELWATIREMPTPPTLSGWFTRRWITAIAAMFAIVVIGVAMFVIAPTDTREPRIVSALRASAPNAAAFDAEGDREVLAKQVNDVLRRDLGVEITVPTPEQLAPHFDFELISVATRAGPRGEEYVEVRLNCCHKPVLLAFVRPGSGRSLFLDETLPVGKVRREDAGDYHTAYRNLGEFTVAAASKHEVADIVQQLRLVGA